MNISLDSVRSRATIQCHYLQGARSVPANGKGGRGRKLVVNRVDLASSLIALCARIALLVCSLVPSGEQLFGAGVPVSELTEPGKAYKLYQAQKPPIKRIVFEQYVEGKFGPAFFLAEGAIQPMGYYLKYPKNSPATSNMWVSGMSSEYEWDYARDWQNVSFGPRQFWTNVPGSMNYYRLEDLQVAARLGLPRPFPDDFVWTSETEFQFSNPWDSFFGRITKFDGTRPLEVEYQSKQQDSPYWRKTKISYEYAVGRDFPPVQFVVDIQRRDSRSKSTCIIHELDVGIDDQARDGYHATSFIPENTRIRNVYFISNLVRYSVRPDGSLVKYKYSDETLRTSSHRMRYTILLIFLAVLIPTAVFLMRRRGGTWPVMHQKHR